MLDAYEAWKENMPAGLEDSPTAQRIGEVLELRGLVEQLATAELPRGFGRD